MAVRETLEFDLRGALAQVGTLEREINDLRKPVKLPIDVTGNAVQDIRSIDDRLEDIEKGVSEVNSELSEMELAAGRSVADFSRLASEMGIAEGQAADLAGEILESRNSSLRVAEAAKEVARQMGLSEDEARRFADEVGKAAGKVDQLDSAAGRASTGGLSKLGAGFKTLIGTALAFVGIREVFSFLGESVMAFSTLEESTSKANVVFGAFAETVLDFASEAPTKLGSTQAAAIEAAATFGNLFLGIGLGQKVAADMSKTLVILATDLASFNNISVQDAMEKLRSGLIGEAEPLRSVGVLLSEAAVQTKALELGLGGLTGKLTEAEKVQARYAIILDQTTTAQGDFARTSDGIANSLRTAKALFDEFKTSVGEGLAPAFAALIKLAPDVIAGFEDMIPNIAGAALALAEFFAPKPGQVDFLDIANGLIDLTRGFGEVIDIGKAATGILVGVGDAASALMDNDFQGIADGFGKVGDSLTDLANAQVDRVGVQSLVQDLRAGVAPALAFANAIAFIGRRGILDPETVRNLLAISGIDFQSARAELTRLIDEAERLHFEPEEVIILRNSLTDLEEGFRGASEANRDYQTIAQTLAGAVDTSAIPLQSQATTLFLLRSEADLLNISLAELIAGGAEKFPELAGLIGSLEPATLGLAAAENNLITFAETFETTNIRISDAIDEFGLLPAKIEVSKKKFLSNLEVSAAEEAAFQANLIELFDIAPALATKLQAAGISTRGLVEQFLADITSAERAESILTGNAEDITGIFTDAVEESIRTSDLDAAGIAALELFLEGFGTTAVAEAGVQALGRVIQNEIDKLKFVIHGGQFSFEGGLAPGEIPGGTAVPRGGQGVLQGGVVVQNTFVVAEGTDVTTQAAQANQSTAAVANLFNRVQN